MTMNVNMESPCAGRTIVDKLISEATPFVAACYGSKFEGDITNHRYQKWKSKMANSKTTSASKLKSLPPSHVAFVQTVHRAHHQLTIRQSAAQSDPPIQTRHDVDI